MEEVDSVLSHSPDVVTTRTGNEYVLVPVANNIADMNSMYTLNETGAFIWEHIDGEKSIRDIIDDLAEEFEVDHDTARNDVLTFMNEMKRYLMVK
jgi:methyltransferase-like protein